MFSLVLEDRRLLFTQEMFNFSIKYCQSRDCEVEVEELNKTELTSSKMLTNRDREGPGQGSLRHFAFARLPDPEVRVWRSESRECR